MKKIMNNLIKDLFNEWEKQSQGKTFYVLMFNPTSTDCFNNIKDINKYLDIVTTDMLLVKSKYSSEELEMYSHDLVSYEIKDGTLIVTKRNGKVLNYKL